MVRAALLLATAVVAAQAPPPGAGLRRLPKPAPAALAFEQSACVDVARTLRVCKVQRTREHSMEVVLYSGGREASVWRSGLPVMGPVFDVRAGDLDADGTEELVIVDHVGTSNGMAVTHHRAFIVRDAERNRPAAISFSFEEFCSECDHGTFVAPRPSERTVGILITEWLRGASLDPGRPAGNYIVGRWFSYRAGRLVPRDAAVARRYLPSLVEQRASGGADAPASWFTGRHAGALARDPVLGSGVAVASRRGVIAARGETEFGDNYTITFDDGGATRVNVGWIPERTEFRAWQAIDAVGLTDGATVLPRGVSPTIVVSDVIGRRVRQVDYRDGATTRRVLWLE